MAITVNLQFTSIGADVDNTINVLPNVGIATPSQVTKSQLLAGVNVSISDDYVSQITIDPEGVCAGTILNVQGNPLSPTSSVLVLYANLGSNPDAENPRLFAVSASASANISVNVSPYTVTEGEFIILAGSVATASFAATGNPDYKTRIEISSSLKPGGAWVGGSFSEQTNSTLENRITFTVSNAYNYYINYKNLDNG